MSPSSCSPSSDHPLYRGHSGLSTCLFLGPSPSFLFRCHSSLLHPTVRNSDRMGKAAKQDNGSVTGVPAGEAACEDDPVVSVLPGVVPVATASRWGGLAPCVP